MPVCQISKTVSFGGRLRVTRRCSDKQTQDHIEQQPKCEKPSGCPQYGFCEESSCMPHLPGMLISCCLVQGFYAVSICLEYLVLNTAMFEPEVAWDTPDRGGEFGESTSARSTGYPPVHSKCDTSHVSLLQ